MINKVSEHKDIYQVVESVLTNLKWISNYVEMEDLSDTANPEEVVDNMITVLEQAVRENKLQALHDENERLGLYNNQGEPVTWSRQTIDQLPLTAATLSDIRDIESKVNGSIKC